MTDNRNNPNWEQRKNQEPQNESRGSKEDANSQSPQDRLKDGTNDLQNGDQNPDSERGEGTSHTNDSSKAG